MLNDSDRELAAQGAALILHRLVPAPDHGRGFRRDPETGFVYYSSGWLSDARPRERYLRQRAQELNVQSDAKPPE